MRQVLQAMVPASYWTALECHEDGAWSAYTPGLPVDGGRPSTPPPPCNLRDVYNVKAGHSPMSCAYAPQLCVLRSSQHAIHAHGITELWLWIRVCKLYSRHLHQHRAAPRWQSYPLCISWLLMGLSCCRVDDSGVEVCGLFRGAAQDCCHNPQHVRGGPASAPSRERHVPVSRPGLGQQPPRGEPLVEATFLRSLCAWHPYTSQPRDATLTRECMRHPSAVECFCQDSAAPHNSSQQGRKTLSIHEGMQA